MQKIVCTLLWVALAANAQTAPPQQHYRDAENGVSFDYVPPWRPLDTGKDTDYLRPSVQPVRAAIVLDVTTPPYPGTDFAGLSFSYAIASASTPAACAAVITQYGDTAPGAPVTVNGVHFSFAEGGDAAMNHQLTERIYSAFANGRCYVFDLSLATAGFGAADDVRQMNDAERKDAEQSLDDLFGTVRIATLK
ncbi:MAG TPA: hypothetical protein VNU94_01010 [Acidobacteriaceae bacterium]|jgi:hypothetical protein|nr:hypothetical protein [Acidobacteriaceae bacterium]